MIINRSYSEQAEELAAVDAWLLAFCEASLPPALISGVRVMTIEDPDAEAWMAFQALLTGTDRSEQANGATFRFTRGGNLHRHWKGPDHIVDVVRELGSGASDRA